MPNRKKRKVRADAKRLNALPPRSPNSNTIDTKVKREKGRTDQIRENIPRLFFFVL